MATAFTPGRQPTWYVRTSIAGRTSSPASSRFTMISETTIAEVSQAVGSLGMPIQHEKNREQQVGQWIFEPDVENSTNALEKMRTLAADDRGLARRPRSG